MIEDMESPRRVRSPARLIASSTTLRDSQSTGLGVNMKATQSFILENDVHRRYFLRNPVTSLATYQRSEKMASIPRANLESG